MRRHAVRPEDRRSSRSSSPAFRMSSTAESRSAVWGLDLTAEERAAGRPVPGEAVRLMARPAFPAIGYRFVANWGRRS